MTFTEWYEKIYGHYPYPGTYNGPAEWKKYKEYLENPSNNPTYSSELEKYQNGDMTAIDFQGVLANNGIQMSPEQTQWLNNEISQQVTNEARDYNTEMRDSSLTSSANQLSSLGLNPASVLQTGGSGIGSSPVADTSKGNPAQEKAMADFQNKAALTRTLIGLLGGLGSAGILGSTRLLARKAASAAAASAANSGLNAIKYDYGGINDRNYGRKWNDMLRDLDF